jgi:hypothetical protein
MCLEGKKNCGGAEGNLQGSVPDSLRAPLHTRAKRAWRRVVLAEPSPSPEAQNTFIETI